MSVGYYTLFSKFSKSFHRKFDSDTECTFFDEDFASLADKRLINLTDSQTKNAGEHCISLLICQSSLCIAPMHVCIPLSPYSHTTNFTTCSMYYHM